MSERRRINSTRKIGCERKISIAGYGRCRETRLTILDTISPATIPKTERRVQIGKNRHMKLTFRRDLEHVPDLEKRGERRSPLDQRSTTRFGWSQEASGQGDLRSLDAT